MRKRLLSLAIALVLVAGFTSSVNAANIRFAKENGGENLGTMYGVFNNPTNITIEDPEKEGYTFEGWATDSEDLTIDEENNQVSVPWNQFDMWHLRTVLDAYGTWDLIDYDITYVLNGGTAEGNPDTYTIEDDEIVINNPTRDGYEFVGWTDEEGVDVGTEATIPAGSMGNKSFVAEWEAIEYNITYELDGGEVEGNPETYTAEDTFTLNNPEKEGYEFVGWTDDEEEYLGTEVTIPAGSIGDKVFVAEWEAIEYNITYELDGGEVEGNPETYTIEDTFTLNNPEKEGYTFVGWIDVEGVDVGTEVTVEEGTTGDLTFTAKWEKEPEEVVEKEEEEEEKVTRNPKTGDGVVAYATVFVVAIAGLTLLVKTRK